MKNIYNSDDMLPFRLLTVSHAEAGVNVICESDDYQYLLIEYVVDGEGFLEIDSNRYHCKPNSIYICPPGMGHRYGSLDKNPWKKLFFVCEGKLIRHLLKAYELEGVYYLDDCSDLLHFFKELELLKNEIDIHKNGALLLHKFCQDIRMKIWSDTISPNFSEQSLRVKNELDCSLNKKINLDELAIKMKLSKQHMIKIFKNNFGVPPYDYLMVRRIESAKIMLTHTTLFIKEISDELCFSDQYHFSNYFKRKVGMSPQVFRNK